MISQMIDFTESRAFRLAGQAAFAEAGIGAADVDHLMIYDAFAHVPIYGLEALGFVGQGRGRRRSSPTATPSPGGALPLNTNGGGLSYTHTGMYGMFAIQEGVRQLRGEAAAQVDSPQVSVILGNGGMFATSGVLVLGARRGRDRESHLVRHLHHERRAGPSRSSELVGEGAQAFHLAHAAGVVGGHRPDGDGGDAGGGQRRSAGRARAPPIRSGTS